jgi:hypothetical protein
VRADVGTDPETFRYTFPAAAALLGCIRRITRCHARAGACCRVGEACKEVAPPGVVNGLGQARLATGPVGCRAPIAIGNRGGTAAELGGLKGLHINHIVLVVLAHQHERRLVGVISALTLDVLRSLAALVCSLRAPVAPLLATSCDGLPACGLFSARTRLCGSNGGSQRWRHPR